MVSSSDLTLEHILLPMPATLRAALTMIDANALGIVFVVDEHDRLQGSLTDGDIRRALLAGAGLDEVITKDVDFFNNAPHALPAECAINDIWNLLSLNLRCIPLLDQEGRVIDFATQAHVRRFPISQPDIGEQEIANVLECVTSGWISSQGRFIPKFESEFSAFLGGGESVAVSNGTVALQLALAAFGIGPGDEVIVPDFTFGASVNAILHTGATPVLVDVDFNSWTLDLVGARNAITARTKAIMPVHLYGQPARLDEINKIAEENGLIVVEDCAEALGATYKSRKIGGASQCACFSFFANKLISTGEGGMVVFASKEVAARARMLRDHGMSRSKKYWHDMAGFNFRMTNMQAAVGVAQLERIEDFSARRKQVFSNYDKHFLECRDIRLLPVNDWSENAYWLYTVVLDGYGENARDELVSRLCHRGIDARPGFYPMHQMAPYCSFGKGDFPVSVYLSENSIGLPSSPGLSKDEIAHIASVFLFELKSVTRRCA